MPIFHSPAKINLFLRILRRREDGYHELASLFQTIDLQDTLHIELSDKDQFTCSDPSLPCDQTNLVSKALALFRRKSGIDYPVRIHLEKRIPQQAGLGGGSSNAATTLWALNRLCGNGASDVELARWASEIGSDISFFFSSGTAYCTGRGEIFRSYPPLQPTNLWVVKPPQGLSTPKVYSKLKAAALPQRDPEKILTQFLNSNPEYFNDLEGPAFEIMPELGQLKEKLKECGFSVVLMSGSGSSFFCLGEGNADIGLDGLEIYPARFCNRSEGSWW